MDGTSVLEEILTNGKQTKKVNKFRKGENKVLT